jgi:hypothetical protein
MTEDATVGEATAIAVDMTAPPRFTAVVRKCEKTQAQS